MHSGLGGVGRYLRSMQDLPDLDFRGVDGDWFERHNSQMIMGLLAGLRRRSYQ
jgi:hypothetical protein